jgi:hypothetical protein
MEREKIKGILLRLQYNETLRILLRPISYSFHSNSSNKRLHSTGMRCRISNIQKGPCPLDTKQIRRIPIIVPHTLRILLDTLYICRIWVHIMQCHQTPHIDPFELRSVATAQGSTWILNNAIRVGNFGDGGFCESVGKIDIGDCGADLVEFGETIKDHALVVGPCWLGCI